MVAFKKSEQPAQEPRLSDSPLSRPAPKRAALSHEFFNGLTPAEFDKEAKELAAAEGMTQEVRARMRAHMIERLKTPVDAPSWGPDWVKAFNKKPKRNAPAPVIETDDAAIIMRNMEKSRQVAHYRPLYAAVTILAVTLALLAMFVDYQIIRGDVWTRALANEFMVVPAALQSSVAFKSLQVLFAVLIIHFMLKITGAIGRNTLIATAFAFALVMIGCLGYLVAYNNMAGATSATLEQQDAQATPGNTIDALLNTIDTKPAVVTQAAATTAEYSLPLPKLSEASLAHADSWFWLAFASVIFFIVSTVAALYMLVVENNVRNFHIARDYEHRQRQFAQLHLLELADRAPQG